MFIFMHRAPLRSSRGVCSSTNACSVWAQCTLLRKNSIDKINQRGKNKQTNKGAASYSGHNRSVKYKTALCGDLQADNAPFNASLARSARGELG